MSNPQKTSWLAMQRGRLRRWLGFGDEPLAEPAPTALPTPVHLRSSAGAALIYRLIKGTKGDIGLVQNTDGPLCNNNGRCWADDTAPLALEENGVANDWRKINNLGDGYDVLNWAGVAIHASVVAGVLGRIASFQHNHTIVTMPEVPAPISPISLQATVAAVQIAIVTHLRSIGVPAEDLAPWYRLINRWLRMFRPNGPISPAPAI